MKRVDFRGLDQTLRDRRRNEAHRPLVGTGLYEPVSVNGLAALSLWPARVWFWRSVPTPAQNHVTFSEPNAIWKQVLSGSELHGGCRI